MIDHSSKRFNFNPLGIRRIISTICILLLTFSITGCGQKGALYLPEQSKAKPQVKDSPDTPDASKIVKDY